MTPRTPVLPLVYLYPGELHVADRPTVVVTVLGSCVSVTFHNRRLRVGAICHAMLPAAGEGGTKEPYRFVDRCVPALAERFDRLGIQRQETEVKVFGGADVLDSPGGRIQGRTIGRMNIDAVRTALEGERFRVLASDVGGIHGRKLYFYAHTGEVLLKRLRRIDRLASRMEGEVWET